MDVYDFISSDEEMPEGWLRLEVSDDEEEVRVAEEEEDKEGEKAVAPTQLWEATPTTFRVKPIRMQGTATPGEEKGHEKQGAAKEEVTPRAHGRRAFSPGEASTIQRLCWELIYSDHAVCEADVVLCLSRDPEGRKVMTRLRRDKPEGWRKKLTDRDDERADQGGKEEEREKEVREEKNEEREGEMEREEEREQDEERMQIQQLRVLHNSGRGGVKIRSTIMTWESDEDMPEDWARAIEEVERDFDPDYTVEEEEEVEEEGNGEEDEQLMNVAKRPRKPRSEPTTRKICPEPGCGRSVVRMDTHFVKCHGMKRGRELHEKVIETKKSATASSSKKGEEPKEKSPWMSSEPMKVFFEWQCSFEKNRSTKDSRQHCQQVHKVAEALDGSTLLHSWPLPTSNRSGRGGSLQDFHEFLIDSRRITGEIYTINTERLCRWSRSVKGDLLRRRVEKRAEDDDNKIESEDIQTFVESPIYNKTEELFRRCEGVVNGVLSKAE
ncbi:cilia- and flagella-associated protein 251-like [Ostrea edulis]|uniref:cilia- and flagella-associated protein 251-like n=1 Tax=Ostrea edulis TaxID=37623 RepID=UPI0024AFE5B5|nr:cilia- and flagella-associated protein 251-like [Ostrea edulis]